MQKIYENTDEPITSKDDDLLNHYNFSKQTAFLFSRWKKNSSLISALYGDWGSGKTSTKNMIVQSLKEYNKTQTNDNEKTIIIEFNPWEWESQNKIIESFFNELTSQLDHKRSKNKELVKLIKKLQKGILSTNKLFEHLTSNSATFIYLLMMFFGLFGLTFEDIPNWIGKFFTATSALLLSLEKILIPISSLFQPTHFDVKQIKQRIAELLRSRNAPIIIILDDLDRLSTEQLKTIIQLVKVNVDFPNTVFLLLYQKDTVEKKLTDSSQNGSEYMKKIIQLPLTIPIPTGNQIHNYLFRKLNLNFNSKNFYIKFYDLWDRNLSKNFKTLRDVKRFLIGIEFYKNHFENKDGKLTIDPMDFFILECVRVYENLLYSIIASNKQSLVNNYSNNSHIPNSLFIHLNLSDSIRTRYIDILNYLFYRGEGDQSPYRIYRSDIFDQYFSLTNSNIPVINKQDYLDASLDNLLQLFNTLYNENKELKLIEAIKDFNAEIPSENIKKHLLFLLHIADKIKSTQILINEKRQIANIFTTLIKRLELNKRSEFLLNEIDITDPKYSILITVYLLADINSTGENNAFLKKEKIAEFKNLFIQKVTRHIHNDPIAFFKDDSLLHVLYVWKNLLEKNQHLDISIAIEEFLDRDPINIFFILEGFKQNYYSHDKYIYFISHKTIADFISIEKIKQAVQFIESTKLTDEQNDLIATFYQNRDAPF